MKNKEQVLKSTKIKKSITPYIVIVGAILVIYSISLLVPLGWGFMTSLKETSDWDRPFSFLSFPDLSFWEVNKQWNLSHPNDTRYMYYDHIFGSYTRFFMNARTEKNISYMYGWNMNIRAGYRIDQGFFDYIVNTLLYAGVSAFLSIMAPCIMGYLCAKFENKFTGIIYAFVVVVMVLPVIGTGAATLTLVKRLSLHDTFWGIWIRDLNFCNMYFLVYYAFFRSLPNTYSEAAEIDGASYFRIMWTIYIPFAIKMVSTAFLIQFVTKYNNYNINLIYLPSKITLAYAAWEYMQSKASYPEKMAASYVLAVPMLIFFVCFKNKLMGNMTVGGLKG